MDFESSFKQHLKKHFAQADHPAQKLLKRSLFHTLFAKASRFRPQLCFAATKALGQKPKKILPWAIAIEMIHSASLIHDDLPLMDDGKIRRGKKCNHKLFGENIALLAGTCLFVESFSLLQSPIFNDKKSQLLRLLTSKIGFQGLMSGQAMDLKGSLSSKKEFLKMIQLKTGSLLSASTLGPLILWGKQETQKKALQSYNQNIGIAYQLADDLKDKDSFFQTKSLALKELKIAIQKSLKAIEPLGKRGEDLKKLSLFILSNSSTAQHRFN